MIQYARAHHWVLVPMLVLAAGVSFFFFSQLGGDGARIAAMCGG